MNEEQVQLEQLDQAQLIARILELRAIVALQNAGIQTLDDHTLEKAFPIDISSLVCKFTICVVHSPIF
jgi:hypothetical protein